MLGIPIAVVGRVSGEFANAVSSSGALTFYSSILYRAKTQAVEINVGNFTIKVFAAKSGGEFGARCRVVGSMAVALMALYGLLSAPVSLIGRSWTSLNPISATQSITRATRRGRRFQVILSAQGKQRCQHSRDFFLRRQIHFLATD